MSECVPKEVQETTLTFTLNSLQEINEQLALTQSKIGEFYPGEISSDDQLDRLDMEQEKLRTQIEELLEVVERL